MQSGRRIGRLALWSLAAALALAVLGRVLERHGGDPFWCGLLFAFGDAALVGGLADWFAVRALFGHPLGFPLPHTALVPRNRARIVAQIRALVLNEWLPRDMLLAKVQEFDFVGSGLKPLAEAVKPHLGEVLRGAGREVLDDIDPGRVAGFLARGLAGAIDADRIGPFLGDLARRAREGSWLEPALREWVRKAHGWASSPTSRATIRRHLDEAAVAYQSGGGLFRRWTYQFAETVGGVDLDAAATVLQREFERFASEQLLPQSPLMDTVRDGLASVEARLRDDPDFLAEVRAFVLHSAESGALPRILEPVLTALKDEARRTLDAPDSPVVKAAVRHLDEWLARVQAEPELRAQVNSWCQRLAAQVVERHHPLIGVLVEEQMARLTDDNLVELIEARVGEDLNWIRINGSLVGGLVGALLYLLLSLLG